MIEIEGWTTKSLDGVMSRSELEIIDHLGFKLFIHYASYFIVYYEFIQG